MSVPIKISSTMVFQDPNNCDFRFLEAINLVHGKMRRHISVHTLAKCLSWSMYFAKSVLMRMHNEKLIDMEQEVAFDGYKVIIDGKLQSAVKFKNVKTRNQSVINSKGNSNRYSSNHFSHSCQLL